MKKFVYKVIYHALSDIPGDSNLRSTNIPVRAENESRAHEQLIDGLALEVESVELLQEIIV